MRRVGTLSPSYFPVNLVQLCCSKNVVGHSHTKFELISQYTSKIVSIIQINWPLTNIYSCFVANVFVITYKAFFDFKVFVIVITIDLGNSVVLDVHVSNVFDVNFDAVLIVITDLCHRISSVLREPVKNVLAVFFR